MSKTQRHNLSEEYLNSLTEEEQKEQIQYLYSEESAASELDANKRRIKEVFGKFGIEISSIKTLMSSTFALYEIVFTPDWRSLQMSSLENEIYHNLSAHGIRNFLTAIERNPFITRYYIGFIGIYIHYNA